MSKQEELLSELFEDYSKRRYKKEDDANLFVIVGGDGVVVVWC